MPKFYKADPLEDEELEEVEKPVENALKQLLTLKKKFGGKYLTGDHFSAGDHHVWASVFLLTKFNLIDFDDGHRDIKKWHDMCAKEPGPKAMSDLFDGIFEDIQTSGGDESSGSSDE